MIDESERPRGVRVEAGKRWVRVVILTWLGTFVFTVLASLAVAPEAERWTMVLLLTLQGLLGSAMLYAVWAGRNWARLLWAIVSLLWFALLAASGGWLVAASELFQALALLVPGGVVAFQRSQRELGCWPWRAEREPEAAAAHQ